MRRPVSISRQTVGKKIDLAVDNPACAITISADMLKLEGLKLTGLSEEELVRAVIAGDKAAYGSLYDRYAPMVRAVCHDRTGNLADAQDLAQDVFLRAYERLSGLRRPDRFGPWLIGIARHRCREWRRRALRDHRRQERAHEMQPTCPDPSDDGEPAKLGRLIAALPETERLALHAFYLQGKSVEEARHMLGLSRSGFYRAIERARQHLRKQLPKDREAIQ
jgi:RNA polymerase sigma-70 factor (ECF subfamily)